MVQCISGIAGLYRTSRILWTLLALLALALPFFGSAVAADWNFRICLMAILAVSWNLMAGAGLISLGHSGFWGLGSYAAILSANQLGIPFWWSLLPAMALGGLVGALLAAITGRLQGIYFAIATLAMSEALRVVSVMLPRLSGGSEGVYLKSGMSPGNLTVNLAAACGALAVALIAWWLSRSRYHFAFRAMRNNEAAAQMFGIHPVRYRAAIMAVSGAMASLAGALSTWYGGYLDPAVAFDLHTTINSQIAPILGGIYTLPGPIVGALAAVGLNEAMRLLVGSVPGASLLVFGMILVICTLYLPDGVYGAWRRMRRKFTSSTDAANSAVPLKPAA